MALVWKLYPHHRAVMSHWTRAKEGAECNDHQIWWQQQYSTHTTKFQFSQQGSLKNRKALPSHTNILGFLLKRLACPNLASSAEFSHSGLEALGGVAIAMLCLQWSRLWIITCLWTYCQRPDRASKPGKENTSLCSFAELIERKRTRFIGKSSNWQLRLPSVHFSGTGLSVTWMMETKWRDAHCTSP